MARPGDDGHPTVTIVAIHQPNFFPWLGYFDKIARCDVFVFLDSVQAQKTGGSWLNRVKFAVNGEARWVTAPIDRAFHGVRLVRDVEFAPKAWREQLLKTLNSAYGRAAHYRQTMNLVEPLIANAEQNAASYNRAAIVALAQTLGIGDRRFVASSTLGVDGHSNDLLVAITRATGGDVYLCGGGAADYFDEGVFAAAGVKVRYQNFMHPRYSQSSNAGMIPGLSIVDALMHCGAEEVAGWLMPKTRT